MKQQSSYGVGLFVLIATLVFGGLAGPMYAAVNVRTVIGDVQFSADGQQWTALTQEMSIQAGDRVRTGADGDVVIQAEDGSVFHLRELSHLKFIELTFTGAVRLYQAELLEGMVNVDVPFFLPDADNDLVRIGTAVAIADATTVNDRPTSFQVIFDPSIPTSECYDFSGIVTLRQIADGSSNFAGLFGGSDNTGREGMTFPVNQNGAIVEMDVQAELAIIIVKSNLGLEEIVAMLGDYMGMEATNIDEKDMAPITLFMPDGEDVLTLEKNGQKIFVATSPSNVILGEAPVYLHGQFKFFRELGTFWVWDLCDCANVVWWGPGPVPTPGPVPPPPPPDHDPSGSPILPGRP